jgi:hypothetical protein
MEIVSGRNKVCKDSEGGLDKIYLFKHVNYSRSQITLNNNVLINYPLTIIYEFKVNNQPIANQTQQEDDGGKFFDLSISLDLAKDLAFEYEKLLGYNLNIIIKDRNGKYRFLGNKNGLECNNLTYETGGGKSSFNGVKLSLNGKEENEAWYINDLTDAGFLTESYLLQENGFNLLQENGFKILL